MKTVIWEPFARAEYDIALTASPTPADFQQTVNDALANIASGLMVYAAVLRTRCRGCSLKVPPYSIVYIETTTEIRVIAFAHQKRRRGYWRDRLP